jgi:hypothetical protein
MDPLSQTGDILIADRKVPEGRKRRRYSMWHDLFNVSRKPRLQGGLRTGSVCVQLLIGRLTIRTLLSMICALLVAMPASGESANQLVQEQVSKLSIGDSLTVQLKSGEKIRGNLQAVGETSFYLQPKGNHRHDALRAAVNLPYQDVQLVKRNSNAAKNAVIAVAIVAGVVVGVALIVCVMSACKD